MAFVLIFLFCEFFYFLNIGIPPKSILKNYNSYYFFLLILPFSFNLFNIISEEKLIKVIKIVFVPIIILAFLQFFLNATVFPVESCDGKFKVYSWNFYNFVRPFSLFSMPGTFFFFIAFIIILFINFLLKYKKSLDLTICLFLSFFILYVTYLRSGYLLIVFSLLAFGLYQSLVFKKYFKFLPLAFFYNRIFACLYVFR